MRSVLISVDFIYREDGTLHPTELNTSTKDDLSIYFDITKENFLSITEGFFNHELLNSFMIGNDLKKIITISVGGDHQIYKMFADYYEYEYENIIVGTNQLTVPHIEDSDDTLIIRIAYDSYALVDDLYARDNYEFHNLIKDETFSSPVTFTENNFDTITQFDYSQDGIIPNYVVKARTPGYIESDYPRGYRFDSMEDLHSLKQNLGVNEFIQKFEYNDQLSLTNGRTHHLRCMSLICGSELEVLNLVHYKSINSISTLNERLDYESDVYSNKQLNNLFLSKYYPTYLSKRGINFHSDINDSILKTDGSLILFSDLQIGDTIQSIIFSNDVGFDGEYDFNALNQFSFGESQVKVITKTKNGIMVNLTITNETYGTFQFYDGVGNNYMIRKPNRSSDVILWSKAGIIEIGDEIMIYHKTLNSVIPFNVSSIFFDEKDLELFLVPLTPEPKFLVQVDKDNTDLYLIQHNPCAPGCAPPAPCGKCADCGKFSGGCVQCGGAAVTDCA